MFSELFKCTSQQIIIGIKYLPRFETNNLRLETNLFHQNMLGTSICFLIVSEDNFTDYPISLFVYNYRSLLSIVEQYHNT